MVRFGWQDFTEDESTDAIPGKYVLTVGTLAGHAQTVLDTLT